MSLIFGDRDLAGDDVAQAARPEVEEEARAVPELDHDAGGRLRHARRPGRAAHERDAHLIRAQRLGLRKVVVLVPDRRGREVVGRHGDTHAGRGAVGVLRRGRRRGLVGGPGLLGFGHRRHLSSGARWVAVAAESVRPPARPRGGPTGPPRRCRAVAAGRVTGAGRRRGPALSSRGDERHHHPRSQQFRPPRGRAPARPARSGGGRGRPAPRPGAPASRASVPARHRGPCSSVRSALGPILDEAVEHLVEAAYRDALVRDGHRPAAPAPTWRSSRPRRASRSSSRRRSRSRPR